MYKTKKKQGEQPKSRLDKSGRSHHQNQINAKVVLWN